MPRFDGTTSWEQYHQVFEAIVRSNGWDNDAAALQLFSHMEGDALNVAHLVPLARRISRSGLVDALTAHYGSPGRLADYRRQFERTTRKVGEDPVIFGTTLETLAVKAFGDMGQTGRLRLIRDRFIAGHDNCDLRRHLDSVPPGMFSADEIQRLLIGCCTQVGGSAVRTSHIGSDPTMCQAVVAAPVTGSLVSISWLNLRETVRNVFSPQKRTNGGTDQSK